MTFVRQGTGKCNRLDNAVYYSGRISALHHKPARSLSKSTRADLISLVRSGFIDAYEIHSRPYSTTKVLIVAASQKVTSFDFGSVAGL